jgi:Bacterial pre-peptidase C-terminal domain
MRAKWLFSAAWAAAVFVGGSGAALAQDTDAPADASTQANLEGSLEAEIGEPGDGDWYRLRVREGMRYQLNLDAAGAPDAEGQSFDPTLAIYDSQGNQIASNDDSSGSLNSALAYTASRTGEIFVEARGFADQSVGRYTLRVESSVAPADDAGNDSSTRARIQAGRSVVGNLEYEGDVDWYKLRVRTGERYRFALNGGEDVGALRDPLLRIFDSAGTELNSNDDSEGSLNSALDFVPRSGGTVFVEAGGFGGAQTGTYRLSVAAEALPQDDAAAATNTRARLAPGQSVSSELGFPSDADWYRVRLTEGESYRFTLNSAGDPALADPYLSLRDADGVELLGDDDSGAGLNSYLEFTAPATGNYFVEARGFSEEATGGYTLSAATGDIPADASTDAALAFDGDYREGVLSPAGDRDWFRVDLAEGAAMRVGVNSAEGGEPLGDPMVVVYGPDGAEIARDDDGGEGLNSYVEIQGGAAGAYFVEVRGFVDDAAGRYAVTLTPGEIGNDANSGEYLTPNGEGRTSTISPQGDSDWFAIEMVEGRPYRFNLESVEPGPLADPMLRLYDANGVEVASDDDGGRGLNSYITFASTAGGTYYAAVAAFGDANATGRYTLRVADTDVPGTLNSDEMLDAAADQRMSRIDMPGDVDSFNVELEVGVTYEIEVSGAGDAPLPDPFLAVLNSEGERVTSDDDSGDGLDARVRFTPPAADAPATAGHGATRTGFYVVQASGLGGGAGWYQVTITRR